LFKVGDKVKAIAGYHIGEVGVVVYIDDIDIIKYANWCYILVDFNDNGWSFETDGAFRKEELELVVDE